MSFLTSFGAYVPCRIVTNAELAPRLNCTPEWITEVSGIEERRYAADEETVVEMAVEAAIKGQEPAFVAKFAFQLAQAFNLFYHHHHILSEADEQKRAFLLRLTELVETQLVTALDLLGIEAPEKM